MTINIREARVGDYLVTPAGKKRITYKNDRGMSIDGAPCFVPNAEFEFFGFTVEREDEWHEHENLGYALECVRRGEEVKGTIGRDWRPLRMRDGGLEWQVSDGRWTNVEDLFMYVRFRTRSAPSSEVLAEWEGEVVDGVIRYGDGARYIGIVPNVSEGDRVKVQVIRP